MVWCVGTVERPVVRRMEIPVWLALADGSVRVLMSDSVQDYYPDDFSHCYGCGRLNTSGYHIRTESAST